MQTAICFPRETTTCLCRSSYKNNLENLREVDHDDHLSSTREAEGCRRNKD
jgi:hypothetical protein